jgi:hypothetical protein
MPVDDRGLARAALSVLRATVRPTPQFPDSVMYLPEFRLRTREEMIEILGAHPVPARWIAVNWTGALAIGSWNFPGAADARLMDEEVRGLREVVSPASGARSPAIFLRGGTDIVPLDVDQALRFQQFYSFPLCGRRVCDVRQHESRALLRATFGAREDDCVLEYRRLLDDGGMHARPADAGES